MQTDDERTASVVIAHTRPIKAVSHVRSTLIQSSLAALKNAGHLPRYLRALPSDYHDAVVRTYAASWLPVELGLAHYRACDSLGLSPDAILTAGNDVSDRIQGPFMETLTRTARLAGVTPWVLLRRFDALWSRIFQGGSIELKQVGPKDLRIEVRSAVLTKVPYFRVAFCGVVRGGYRYTGTSSAFVRIVSWDDASDCFTMRAAWV